MEKKRTYDERDDEVEKEDNTEEEKVNKIIISCSYKARVAKPSTILGAPS